MRVWDICNYQALETVQQGVPTHTMQTFIPQPRSPAQLALVGALLWLVGALVHLTLLAPIGIALLVVAGIGQLIRPHSREMYWRGRRIELDDSPSVAHRVYRAVFRE
jgi:hypothetical protein